MLMVASIVFVQDSVFLLITQPSLIQARVPNLRISVKPFFFSKQSSTSYIA